VDVPDDELTCELEKARLEYRPRRRPSDEPTHLPRISSPAINSFSDSTRSKAKRS